MSNNNNQWYSINLKTNKIKATPLAWKYAQVSDGKKNYNICDIKNTKFIT
jgi:hypothetical protein